jgi:hypothetical protein
MVAAMLLGVAGVEPLMLIGAVLLGLLILLSLLGRRLRGGNAGRESVALTGQHAVHVVEIAGRRLLLGTGPSGAPRVLAELGEVEAVELEAGPTLARPWAELVERFGGLGGR